MAVVRKSQRSKLGAATSDITISSIERIRDGFNIRTHAPTGGIVVVNTVPMPFWTATADGKSLEIIPVNYIQMGVRVPAGSQLVEFNYHRPDLSDLFRQLFL